MDQCRATEIMVMKMEVGSISETLFLSACTLTLRVEAIVYSALTMTYNSFSHTFSLADLPHPLLSSINNHGASPPCSRK
jgi:hypothetical protein